MYNTTTNEEPKHQIKRKKSPRKKSPVRIHKVHHERPKKPISKIKNVVLDLDETLISSIEISELNSDPKLFEKYKERVNLFKHYRMDDDFIITERPGLQEFLDFLFENYKVSVWTAASKDYALFIVKNIILCKPGRKLEVQMYSEHCDSSKQKTGCPKQLNQLWSYADFNPNDTLIIDDNKHVINKQSNMVIAVKPFNFLQKNSEKDTFLHSKVRKQILDLSFKN